MKIIKSTCTLLHRPVEPISLTWYPSFFFFFLYAIVYFILAQCFLHLHWILPLTMDYEPTLKKLKLPLKEPPNVTPLYIRSFFLFIFISWRLITLQYCSGFCHTLTWISHGFTCIPHPNPASYLPLQPIPLGLPSAPGPSTCLVPPAWAGDLFHPR